MSFASRLQYYRRIFSAYLLPGTSQLTFWHDRAEINGNAKSDALGEYYMVFAEKADYAGPFDERGIPLLDYHGKIGLQHNPIAIAQWGLGNYNSYCRNNDPERKRRFIAASQWLCDHLEQNPRGVWVWNHHFDWEYRSTLRSPWYSGLAQGQGISLLLRTHAATGENAYLETARLAFESFLRPLDVGGVAFTDEQGDVWFEEYLVTPPTHILNGFIWAAWCVYDYFLATRESAVHDLFSRASETIAKHLQDYDAGFWSLYELSGTRVPMLASPFYHRLHIAQLRIMYGLTGNRIFADFADRWENYTHSRVNRARALFYKGIFKLGYY